MRLLLGGRDAGALPLCRRCPDSRTPHFRVACPSWSVGLRGSREELPLRRRLGGGPTDSPTRVAGSSNLPARAAHTPRPRSWVLSANPHILVRTSRTRLPVAPPALSHVCETGQLGAFPLR